MKNDSNLDFKESALKFYKKVANSKLGSGIPAYSNITKLITFVLILPHSTATVERIFSAVTLNKTKLRNKMKRKILSGILSGKNLLRISKKNCFNYEISQGRLIFTIPPCMGRNRKQLFRVTMDCSLQIKIYCL